MNVARKILASLGMGLLFVAVLSAAQVKTDYDRSVDFNRYRTYSWQKVRSADPLWVDRIKNSVDAALESKGWVRVETGGDAAVVAIEMTHDEKTLNTFYNSFGGGWRWGGNFGNATTTVDTYEVGTLVVDIFDAKSKNVIWRGSASGTLSNKSDNNIKNLDKDAQKLFERFPPEKKK